jgi:NAD+ diphosphatase
MAEGFLSLSYFEGEPGSAHYFAFKGRELLVQESSPAQIPVFEDNQLFAGYRNVYLGKLHGTDCFAIELPQDYTLPVGMALLPLRTVIINFASNLSSIANRAVQLLDWDRDHKFCGRCGNLMENVMPEHSKKCPVCGLVNYPRISPAIIVLVHDGDKVLLTRSPHFKPGVFSVQAGFVEAGESLEDTVRREIFEETGLKVKDITYFGSQPWPFPNSLMVGFTAAYESGELKLDPVEIEAGGWHRYNELPTVPDSASISRKLIDWFTESRAKD